MTISLKALRICFIATAMAASAAVADNLDNSGDKGVDGDIVRQRTLFANVYPDVERGSWTVIETLPDNDRQRLEDYILWPDLRATWMRANIRSVSRADVESFVARYGTLKPAKELRYRYALNFVRNKDLASYLDIYEQFYQGQDLAKLDCLALQAEIEAGRHGRVDVRAKELWLVGKSQVIECDPVFAYLKQARLLGLLDYQKRFELAIDVRNFSLAKWLAKSIDAAHVEQANHWLQAQSNPEDFLRQKWKRSDDAAFRAQLAYATERLTYRDPIAARDAWARIARRYQFSEADKLRTAQHIALWTARDNLPGAYKLLKKLPSAAQSAEVLRWRARTSLRARRWSRLQADIAAMPNDERNTEEWRYWQAIAQVESGDALAAMPELERLSGERSFYGFLAADKLNKTYALENDMLAADNATLAQLESRPAVIRARELFYVGQESRGRSEWDALVRHLPDDEKRQAAILAHSWGWHSRAIATAASLGHYDDLAIRYPLPYQASFKQFSTDARIEATWAYGIARSESLFMRDVRSSAGAIGLMQLMPATGKSVANRIKLPYSGLTTLIDPESNIRLGTSYLGEMADRYGGNPVLATAAYNAGPRRVDAWLPQQGSIDARTWIENIPFNETRKYVKRVLAAQAIFHWRMTGTIRRVSDELGLIHAAPETVKVASR